MSDVAGIRLGSLTAHADFQAAADLLARIWGTGPDCPPFPADLFRSLEHAGACVLGAWTDSGALVGVTVGVAGGPGSDSLYSLVAGVAAEAAGAGVGRRLKLAQRDWARAHGARSIVWTYDPLIRRNAHFNLDRLGADVTAFLEDYYPPMLDAINAGDLTDRFFVEWDVSPDAQASRPVDPDAAGAPRALECDPSGEPSVRQVDGPAALAWIPPDIEALRRTDPQLAMRWRLAAREVFRELFGAGYRPVRTDPQGHYVFTLVHHQEP